MFLTQADRAAIERLVFDPSLAPRFELLKSCLVWEDERPRELSSDGYQYLTYLWAVRGFIHKGVPFERWGLDPEPFRHTWNDAFDTCLRWPGFRRLGLSTRDRAFLSDQLAKNRIEDIFRG